VCECFAFKKLYGKNDIRDSFSDLSLWDSLIEKQTVCSTNWKVSASHAYHINFGGAMMSNPGCMAQPSPDTLTIGRMKQSPLS